MKLFQNKEFNIPIFTDNQQYYNGKFYCKITDLKRVGKSINFSVDIVNDISELNSYIESSYVDIILNIESSNPAFRKTIALDNMDQVHNIPDLDYKAQVDFTFLIVSKRSFDFNYKLGETNYTFNVDKHQIIGFSPTESYSLGDEVTNNNFFTIKKGKDKFSYSLEENQFIITVPSKNYIEIEEYKENKNLSSILISLIVTPALTYLVLKYYEDKKSGDELSELMEFVEKNLPNNSTDETVAEDVQLLLNNILGDACGDLIRIWRSIESD